MDRNTLIYGILVSREMVDGMPKEEIEKKCKTCKYFRFGLWCYRYPQIAKKNKNDYCGEWERK